MDARERTPSPLVRCVSRWRRIEIVWNAASYTTLPNARSHEIREQPRTSFICPPSVLQGSDLSQYRSLVPLTFDMESQLREIHASALRRTPVQSLILPRGIRHAFGSALTGPNLRTRLLCSSSVIFLIDGSAVDNVSCRTLTQFLGPRKLSRLGHQLDCSGVTFSWPVLCPFRSRSNPFHDYRARIQCISARVAGDHSASPIR
jgi:hypothetical protein